MFEEVSLLPEGLGAVLALERLLPRVRAHVDLDVALVEKTPVANITVMHHLFVAGTASTVATAAAAAHAAQLRPVAAPAVLLLDLRQAAQLVEPPLKSLIRCRHLIDGLRLCRMRKTVGRRSVGGGKVTVVHRLL